MHSPSVNGSASRSGVRPVGKTSELNQTRPPMYSDFFYTEGDIHSFPYTRLSLCLLLFHALAIEL
jgi:hypothetical protein